MGPHILFFQYEVEVANTNKGNLCLLYQGESNCKIENKIWFYSVQYTVSKNNYFSSKIVMIKKKPQNTLTIKKKKTICDAPISRCPLTTRQPAENLCISYHETHTSKNGHISPHITLIKIYPTNFITWFKS